MVTEEENNINIGDLVKWFSYYADGDIVKDAGHGLVLRISERLSPHGGPLFLVARPRHGDQQWYSRPNIDLVAEADRLAKKKAQSD